MKDFRLRTYRELLLALQQSDYSFYTVEEYCAGKAHGRYIILRHDVDLKANHSLSVAKIEAKMGIRATYYFRVVPQSNQPEIIKAIADLGHEIGYHYEDLSLYHGNEEKALEHFKQQLTYFRQFYPVRTICMHGSPVSKWDNRDLWKTHSYRDHGIMGEPYFDIDFNKLSYLTDTGRSWNGDKFNRRDKVKSNQNLTFRNTAGMITAIQTNRFPTQLMITTHPQRWTDKKIEWISEIIIQFIKNQIKLLMILFHKS